MAELSLQHIEKVYDNQVKAVHDFNLEVKDGEMIVLVGPSGCGKSTTLRMIAGLEDISSGKLLLDGKDVTDAPAKDRDMAMVFQNYALYGHMTIYENMAFSLMLRKEDPNVIHQKVLAAAEILDLTAQLGKKPSQLSGGQRQRVLIAMALTRDPKIVIADEPTTALDVTVQKQVVDLLNRLQHELGFAMVFVSHDLALVAEVANSITVMYAGQIVEQGPVKEIMTNPIHEYTRGLLGSVLSIEAGGDRLHQVPGSVPSPKDFPEGDRFRPRSSHPDKISNVPPMLKKLKGTDHYYAELPDSELVRIGLEPLVPAEGRE